MNKKCTLCEKEKNINEFFKAKRQKSGYHSACKKCHTLGVKRWREANPKKWQQISNAYSKANWRKYVGQVSEWRRGNTLRLKLDVYSHYCKGNIRCTCCEEKQIMFLSLDHINNDGAAHKKELFGKSRRGGGTQLYQWAIKNNYPSNLQVLCMNCNHGKRLNKGICPHKLSTRKVVD